jgi:uncharacterized protein
MGKVLFWVVIALLIMFALRFVNIMRAKSKKKSANPSSDSLNETMVRCVKCGVYLPRQNALMRQDGYHCDKCP